jgi:DNA-binding transcriptional LysR family regulator
MDRLLAMTVFRRVVELNGFAAAARDLRFSNAAVSKQVAQLEERLGVRLLNRTTRRSSLTEAGRVYYDSCVRILDEIAETEQLVSQQAGTPRGLLRVNAPMSFGIRHLGPVLPDFLARHPEVTVDLALDDRIVALVQDGFDMAVRIADMPDSSLVARRFATNRRLLVASPAYLARHGAPEQPSDLARHNCLIYSYLNSREDVWRFSVREGEETVTVSGCLRTNNGDVLADAAAAGIGIGLLPAFIVDAFLTAGRLIPLLPAWDAGLTGIFAVYPPGRHLSPKVRAFADFLVERFAAPSWS